MRDFKIVSAFSQPSIPEVIYIEAPSPADIRRTFERVHTVYLYRGINLVPTAERVQLLELGSLNVIAKGDWVRIKRGTYKGDVGYVVNTDTFHSRVRLRLLPCLSYQKNPGGLKRALPTRPSPTLFDPERVRKVFGLDSVKQRRNGYFTFKAMTFKNNLLERHLGFHDLDADGVRPTLQEIGLFGQSLGFDQSIVLRWEAEEATAALNVGDRVEILRGEQKGCIGTIIDKRENIAQVHVGEPERITVEDLLLDIPAGQLCKSFKLGDYIQVRHGIHAGEYGHIVKLPELGPSPSLVVVGMHDQTSKAMRVEKDPVRITIYPATVAQVI